MITVTVMTIVIRNIRGEVVAAVLKDMIAIETGTVEGKGALATGARVEV